MHWKFVSFANPGYIFKATDYGYVHENSCYFIQWMTDEMAPADLLEPLQCKSCKTGCTTNRCICFKMGNKCNSTACGCKSCKNINKPIDVDERLQINRIKGDDDDDDDDDDDNGEDGVSKGSEEDKNVGDSEPENDDIED